MIVKLSRYVSLFSADLESVTGFTDQEKQDTNLYGLVKMMDQSLASLASASVSEGIDRVEHYSLFAISLRSAKSIADVCAANGESRFELSLRKLISQLSESVPATGYDMTLFDQMVNKDTSVYAGGAKSHLERYLRDIP